MLSKRCFCPKRELRCVARCGCEKNGKYFDAIVDCLKVPKTVKRALFFHVYRRYSLCTFLEVFFCNINTLICCNAVLRIIATYEEYLSGNAYMTSGIISWSVHIAVSVALLCMINAQFLSPAGMGQERNCGYHTVHRDSRSLT